MPPERLLEGVWRVTGSFNTGPLIRLSRNMVIVAHDESLMLVKRASIERNFG